MEPRYLNQYLGETPILQQNGSRHGVSNAWFLLLGRQQPQGIGDSRIQQPSGPSQPDDVRLSITPSSA